MRRRIYEPLSNFDINDFYKEIKNKKANIQTYESIKKHKDCDKLFKNLDYCIIFLQNNDKSNPIGHWVCVFKNNNNVYFADSYGFSIKQLCPILMKILAQKYNTVESNRVKYQQINDNSATCGRHCLMNVALNSLIPNYNFAQQKKIMDFLMKKNNLKNYNEVVSKFIDIDL